jgi:hypothetical protein
MSSLVAAPTHASASARHWPSARHCSPHAQLTSPVAHVFAVQARSFSNVACAAADPCAPHRATHASSAHASPSAHMRICWQFHAVGAPPSAPAAPPASPAGAPLFAHAESNAHADNRAMAQDSRDARRLTSTKIQPRLQWLVPERAFLMTSMSSARCCSLPTKSMSDALTMSSGPSP